VRGHDKHVFMNSITKSQWLLSITVSKLIMIGGDKCKCIKCIAVCKVDVIFIIWLHR